MAKHPGGRPPSLFSLERFFKEKGDPAIGGDFPRVKLPGWIPMSDRWGDEYRRLVLRWWRVRSALLTAEPGNESADSLVPLRSAHDILLGVIRSVNPTFPRETVPSDPRSVDGAFVGLQRRGFHIPLHRYVFFFEEFVTDPRVEEVPLIRVLNDPIMQRAFTAADFRRLDSLVHYPMGSDFTRLLGGPVDYRWVCPAHAVKNAPRSTLLLGVMDGREDFPPVLWQSVPPPCRACWSGAPCSNPHCRPPTPATAGAPDVWLTIETQLHLHNDRHSLYLSSYLGGETLENLIRVRNGVARGAGRRPRPGTKGPGRTWADAFLSDPGARDRLVDMHRDRGDLPLLDVVREWNDRVRSGGWSKGLLLPDGPHGVRRLRALLRRPVRSL